MNTKSQLYRLTPGQLFYFTVIEPAVAAAAERSRAALAVRLAGLRRPPPPPDPPRHLPPAAEPAERPATDWEPYLPKTPKVANWRFPLPGLPKVANWERKGVKTQVACWERKGVKTLLCAAGQASRAMAVLVAALSGRHHISDDSRLLLATRSPSHPARLAASAGDLRHRLPEETGGGICPSALGNSASFVNTGRFTRRRVLAPEGTRYEVRDVDPADFPELQAESLQLICRFDAQEDGFVPHLVAASPSALLEKAGAPAGPGVFAAAPFRGPRTVVSTDASRREPGSLLGHFGGRIVARAGSERAAEEACHDLVLNEGRRHLLVLQPPDATGFVVVDGNELSVLPSLQLVNDCRNTSFRPRCAVGKSGAFHAIRDIPALDFSRPLSTQAASELSIEYGDGYWRGIAALEAKEKQQRLAAAAAQAASAAALISLRAARKRPLAAPAPPEPAAGDSEGASARGTPPREPATELSCRLLTAEEAEAWLEDARLIADQDAHERRTTLQLCHGTRELLHSDHDGVPTLRLGAFHDSEGRQEQVALVAGSLFPATRRSPHTVELNQLFVQPHARRGGLGTRMVRNLLEEAQRREATHWRLGVGMSEQQDSIGFWQKVFALPSIRLTPSFRGIDREDRKITDVQRDSLPPARAPPGAASNSSDAAQEGGAAARSEATNLEAAPPVEQPAAAAGGSVDSPTPSATPLASFMQRGRASAKERASRAVTVHELNAVRTGLLAMLRCKPSPAHPLTDPRAREALSALALAMGWKRVEYGTLNALAAVLHAHLQGPGAFAKQMGATGAFATFDAKPRACITWRNLLLAVLNRVSAADIRSVLAEERGEGTAASAQSQSSAAHAPLQRTRHAPSSSDLRAERAEERGEGAAASAFCTSASHAMNMAVPVGVASRKRTALATTPSVTHLVPVHAGERPLVCLPAGGGTFSTSGLGLDGAARKSATEQGASVLSRIAPGVTNETTFMAGVLRDEMIIVGVSPAPQQQQRDVCGSRAQVLARSLEFGPQHPVWCPLDVVGEGCGSATDENGNDERERTYSIAAAAIARTLSHKAPTATLPNHQLAIGANVGGAVSRNASEAAAPASFQLRYQRAIQADKDLRRELIDLADSCGDIALAATYLAWADRFSPPPLEDIPAELQTQARDFTTVDHLATMPFAQRCEIPRTEAVPPPQPQAPLPDGWQPRRLEDVLTRKAIRSIDKALARFRRWHIERIRNPRARRPQALALGISAFVPRARGRIWDLRACSRTRGGAPKLLDTATAPLLTHLNVDYIARVFGDCLDQELISMLCFGVCLHVALPPQIVIMPNLLSLYDGESGIDAAARSVTELSRLGWWQQHDFIPFAPWRCAPRGAVPRKDGGEARGIVDHGAPRDELQTRDEQERVPSLNEACRDARVRREVKPRFGDLACSSSILLHLGDKCNEPVFVLAFDFAKFFHQLWFRPEELHRMGALLPMADGQGRASSDLSIHTELVMAMGLTPSSEIAQRLANILMQEFSKRMAAEEARCAPPADATVAAWLSRRASLPHDMLGSQSRLWDAMCYTDDPAMVVLGVKRAARAIRIWHDIVQGTGLMPAKASKWQIGAGALWLGGCCFPSLGIMWVPRDKAMRSCERIDSVLRGSSTPTEYRELVGFLEHVLDIGKFPRELMDYLHEPMRAGGPCERDPHGVLPPDERRDGYLRKWRSILLNAPGSSLLAACQPERLEADEHVVWRLRSDAMLEPFASAMGGVLYGSWWRFPLRRAVLTIPALELLAACLNFIIFEGKLRSARHVVMEIDALASPTVLHRDKARSPALRAILLEFRRLPQLRAFVRPHSRLHAVHTYGEANPLADAASRGYINTLREMYAALGTKLRRVQMGSEALAFVDRVLLRLDSAPLTVAEREFDSTLGYPGEGTASPELISFIERSEEGADRGATFDSSSPIPLQLRGLTPAATSHGPALASTPSPSVHPVSALSGTGELQTADEPALPHGFGLPIPTTDYPDASLSPMATAREEAMRRDFAASECARIRAEEDLDSFLREAVGMGRGAEHASARAAPHAEDSTTGAGPSCRLEQANGSAASATTTSTLSAAARARAFSLAETLQADSEGGGIRLAPGEAHEVALQLVSLLEGAAAAATLNNERSNWRHWLAFCSHRGISPTRRDVRCMNHGEYDKEVVILAMALLFVYGRMRCRRGRSTPPRPASALAVLRGIRRAHDRLGVQMADLALASRLALALNRKYIANHGWDSLQPQRVEPLTTAIIVGMINADAIAGPGLAEVSARALWATLAQTGFRKAEVSLSAGEEFGPHCLTRHSLRWRINGVDVADPTGEQLRNLREGDLAILIPPRSKCDQYGLEWGQSPIFLRFHHSTTAPFSAARQLRDLELAFPKSGRAQREGTALFVDGHGEPLFAKHVYSLFHKCLEETGVADCRRKLMTPHSFRRHLACALKAAGAADSTIQALLRWKSAESLKLYAILNDNTYADLVDSAANANVASVRTASLPRSEMLDAAHTFRASQSRLQAAADQAAARAPADDNDSELELSSDDEAEAPPSPPVKRRRTRAAATQDAAPPEPLALRNALGRQVLVPASLWPDYSCSEHEGAGWSAVVRQVERRASAVLVSFSHARDSQGRAYPDEWLELASLRAG